MRQSRWFIGGPPERGFSLIELTVAVGVFGIIGTIVGAILVSTTSFTRRGTTQTEAQQLARVALSHMAQELREGQGGPEAISIWPGEGEPFEAIGLVSAREEAAGRSFGTDRSGAPMWRTAVYSRISNLTARREARGCVECLYCCGFARDDDGAEADTQWVRPQTSPFSSRSTRR